jgi:uncharacterized protein
LTEKIVASSEDIRRLAVTKQHLAGKLPTKPDSDDILGVVRDLGCVQLDPISAVAPSHLIVLWSRLGNFDRADLDRLLWGDKKLFEYWAHQQSIVLMEDYPLYYTMMRGYPHYFVKPWGSAWSKRVEHWLSKNSDLKKRVLTELKKRGPLLSRQFEDETRVKRPRSGWSSGGDVSRMLFNLFFMGEVMSVGREGNQKLWGLSEKFLPSWVSKKQLPADQLEYIAVQRSIKALGTATRSEIDYHFLRGRYRNLKSTLKRLEDDSKIHQVKVSGEPLGKGERYVHHSDLPLLDELKSHGWEPRLSLLSPFDNLICDRNRTRALFNFDFTIEIYTPAHKRKYGYYVLPILFGDKLIGRIDPLLDRKNGQLQIKAVHAERKAPREREVAAQLKDKIQQLSDFLGAKKVVYSKKVPRFWRASLH